MEELLKGGGRQMWAATMVERKRGGGWEVLDGVAGMAVSAAAGIWGGDDGGYDDDGDGDFVGRRRGGWLGSGWQEDVAAVDDCQEVRDGCGGAMAEVSCVCTSGGARGGVCG
ncbi:pollen-specific leucine-rich repeat extensin-like protein 3 [Iris pallida]|uniref:Pollen-specific leucine-rich repeat extensin-like protein 3 n=1 Tax=Iris pallida TaxID=29817 RepID=A0AAX6HU35_IRIPA|nr:pollen-specific leucine-rich repeat extensin-like protein 3 [Iris pallida]